MYGSMFMFTKLYNQNKYQNFIHNFINNECNFFIHFNKYVAWRNKIYFIYWHCKEWGVGDIMAKNYSLIAAQRQF
jgi:hypothetical protein